MEFFKMLFRTTFFYFLILFLYRFIGKKKIKEFNVLEFLLAILIIELMAISIINLNDTFWLAFMPIIILVLLQIGMFYVSLKSKHIKKILEDKPTIIINNGQVVFEEMLKKRYNLDYLLEQLTSKNYKSIDEVECAILEPDGSLSVYKKIKANQKFFPLPLILDGKINYEILTYLKRDENWLLNNLSENLEDVFYAFYQNKNIYIIKKNDLL